MVADDDREEIRAFIREHHPDRGGDPEEFRLGLERLRTRPPEPQPATRVVGQPRGTPLLGSLRRRLARRRQPPRVR